MNNLKKVLALVLVVATLCGFMTVAGAKDFTDADSIKNTEAVEVMKLINVINGYPDGSFKPNGTITRAEMAKMIAFIVSGGEDINEDLYAGANPYSDCIGHWARGAIAYANTTGIIAGVGNGKFDPNSPVTGAQAAKMLLVALGYDAEAEGFVGQGWAVNVLSKARAAGLLKGLTGINMNVALSRDNAAQLMFNALKADTITYVSKAGTVEFNGAVVTTGTSVTKKTESDNTVKYNNVADDVEQLVEKYFSDLQYKSTGSSMDSEAFGRPGHKWVLKKDEAGPYTDAATLTYTAAKDADDIEKDLDGAKNTADITVKGTETDSTITASTDSETLAGKLDDYTGNGTIVEVYIDDGEVTNVVVIKSSVGTLSTKDFKATNARGAYTQYTVSGVGATGVIYTTHVDEDAEKTTVVLHGDVQKDDVVTCYKDKADPQVLHIFPTTEVSGVVSRISSDGADVTVGGTKYSLAAGNVDEYNVSKDEQSFALDRFGYIVKRTVAAEDTLYGMILRDASYLKIDGNTGKNTPAVDIVTTEGKVERLDVTEAISAGDKGAVVTYSANSKGIYTLTKVSSWDAGEQVRAKSIADITKDSTGLKDGGGSIVSRASNSTLFVFANHDDDGPDGTVTTVTGYKNVSSYTVTTAVALDTDSTKDGVANVVFVWDDVKASGSDEFVYVKGTWAKTSDGKAWDVIIQGEETTLVVNKDSTKALDAGMHASVAITSDDFVGTSPIAATSAIYNAVSYKDGLVTLTKVAGGDPDVFEIADDVVVYLIDATKGASKAAPAGELAASELSEETGSVYVTKNSGNTAVTAMYIVYVP